MSTDVSGGHGNSEGAPQGLDALRRAERTRVSRALHDEIGPSLCSAGLMLGLIRSAWPDIPQDSRDLLDAIQDALETSVDSVRVLSYQSDPGIAARCGLRSALQFLTQGRPVQLVLSPGLHELTPEQADALCLTVLDLLLAWPAGPHRLQLHPGGFTLTTPPGATLPACQLAALSLRAAHCGMTFSLDSGTATASLTAKELS
jgi:hypothetical protein